MKNGYYAKFYVPLVVAIAFSVSCSSQFDTLTEIAGTEELNSRPPEDPPPPPLDKDTLKWSDPATWGGTLPKANDVVMIPQSKTILLDINTPVLSNLTINGKLIFDRKNVQLNSETIQINTSGSLEIGTPESPFTQKAIINLSGDPKTNSSARGIFINGGKLLLNGNTVEKPWTQINNHAQAGAKALQLKESIDWKVGDQIIIAPTDYKIYDTTELNSVKSVSGSNVELNAPLARFKWGLLQHVTRTGMALQPDPGFVPPEEPFPRILDQRAEVGNLTRNIVIQSVDDTLWKNEGLGAHVMIMGLQSVIQIYGVELQRVGQAGIKTRYPIHWHMLSYDSLSGDFLGVPKNHYLKNSTIWNSMNRCVVIHGTNGLLIENNICYEIKGHAFFMEDAVERDNILRGNLALKVRKPAEDKKLLVHEGDVFQGGPSGYWLTNPDNTVVNNVAADTDGNGFWMAYPQKPLGLSKSVSIIPTNIRHGHFEGNVAHSVTKPGFLLEWVPTDDNGNLTALKYSPTTTEKAYDYTNAARFELKRLVSYKNMEGAYRNRATVPEYLEWVSADNVGRFFSGAVDDANLRRHLVVSKSLNNRNPYPEVWPFDPPSAFASYHSTLHFINNVIVNFEYVQGKNSGTFGTEDYYTTPVDRGPLRNPGNNLINSHPGYRHLPVEFRDPPVPDEHWTLAGALWDPYGYVGIAGQYWVYDKPFLTYGKTCQPVSPAGQNGASCNGEYYGVVNFWSDVDPHDFEFKTPLDVTRQLSNGTIIDKWTVGDGNKSKSLAWMRHFAATLGGEYILRFPGYAKPKQFGMTVQNASKATDSFIFAVEYAGKDNPTVYTVSDTHYKGPYVPPVGSPSRRDMSAASSLTEVRNSSGDKYYVDRTRSLIWIKYVGGLQLTGNFTDPWSESSLYKNHAVFINGL